MLDGKVVIVTGGAGLLGKAFCAAVAKAGGVAVIASRDADKGQAAAIACQAEAGRGTVAFEPCDATDPQSVETLLAKVVERFGRLDAVVNNAFPRGPNYGRRFEDVAMEDLRDNIHMHLGGYVLVCQKALECFRAQGGGNIVNLGSIYGVIAPRFGLYEGTRMTKEIEYSLSKAAIVQLTRYLAAYCKGQNIRVNCLSPGGILDGQPEAFLKRYGAQCLNKGMLAPEDVAGTLVWLLSDASAHVNGQNIVVDDGFVLGTAS